MLMLILTGNEIAMSRLGQTFVRSWSIDREDETLEISGVMTAERWPSS